LGETITIKIIKQNNARIFMGTTSKEEALQINKKKRRKIVMCPNDCEKSAPSAAL